MPKKPIDVGTLQGELAQLKSRDFELQEKLAEVQHYRDLLAGPYDALAAAAKRDPAVRNLDPAKLERDHATLAGERLKNSTRQRELEAEIARQEAATRKAAMDAALAEYPGLMRQFAEAAVNLARLSERAAEVRASVNHQSSSVNDPFEVVGFPGLRPSDLVLTNPQSTVCLLIREFVSQGRLTGAEAFLSGVTWQI
jgi:hypothetical protein